MVYTVSQIVCKDTKKYFDKITFLTKNMFYITKTW